MIVEHYYEYNIVLLTSSGKLPPSALLSDVNSFPQYSGDVTLSSLNIHITITVKTIKVNKAEVGLRTVEDKDCITNIL